MSQHSQHIEHHSEPGREVDSFSSQRPVRKLNPVVMLLIMGGALSVVFLLGMALLRTNLRELELGKPAPTFVLDTHKGDKFSLEHHRGNVVVINFWASWCAPCRSEAADLNAVFVEYKERGVAFIGVGRLDNESDARKFIQEFNIPFPTAPDNGTQVYDNYRCTGVPETFVVDRNGNLAKAFRGPVTAGQLREVLSKLVAS